MSSIGEIENDLRSIESRVANHTENLERSRVEISEAMNKAQEQFGKDRNGQNTVMAMSQALNTLSSVDSILYALKSDIDNYVDNIKK